MKPLLLLVAILLTGCATTQLERGDGATAECKMYAGSGILGLLTAPLVAIDHKHCIDRLEAEGYTVKTTRPY